MSAPLRKFFRRFAIVAATLAVVCGLLLGAFQLAVTRVPEYRVQLQTFLQQRTGLAIEFRELSARLRLRGPELVFKGLVVRTPDRTRVLATARRGSVGFDLWHSIGNRQLTSGKFTLDNPEIGLMRTREGRIQLVGLSALPERDKPFAIAELPVGSFEVRNAVVSFRDEATGRGPWALSGVNFVLDRQRELLDLRGAASLPPVLGKSLNFAARTHGNFAKPETLFSSVSVDGVAIDLAGWADMLPDNWPAPDSGNGALRVTATFHGSVLANVTAKADLRSVTAAAPSWSIPLPQSAVLKPLPPGAATAAVSSLATVVNKTAAATAPAPIESPVSAVSELVSYQRIAFGLRAQQREHGWELALSDVDLSRADAPWQSKEILARWSRSDSGALDVSGKADRIQLQNLWPLLAYVPESEQIARIRAMHASGAVTGLEFDFKSATSDAAARFTFNAGVQQLAVQPVLSSPGATAITGELRATDNGGEFKLDARDVSVAMPGIFREALQMRAVQGQLAWHREPHSWRLTSSDLQLDSADGHVNAALTLDLPHGDGSPVLDLRASVQNIDATATRKYLPPGHLSAKTLEWLDHAFVAGRVVNGDVVIKGPLRSFPFRKRDGEFVARAQVRDMTLNYQNGWVPATQLSTVVEFRNQGMSARAIDARIGDLQIKNAHGEFPDFRTGEITIEADAAGDLGHALAFLRASPVGAALGPVFNRVRGSGPTQSKVAMWLPLQRIADRKITVETQVTGATAFLDGIDTSLTALDGSLTVQQTLLSHADLRGQLLGGSVQIGITKDSDTSSTLTANGHALATQLIPFLPGIVRISGATDWQLGTRIRAGQAGKDAQSWQITAAMDGLGVSLPAPLGKMEQGARPLHADLEIGESLLARAAYGDVRALLKMQQQNARWTFDRGGVRADGVAAALPAHRGLRIEGDVDRLVLDDWFALRATPDPANAASTSTSTSKLSDILQAANVRVGELNLYGYKWRDVRGVLQATDTGWRVDAAGPDISGQVQIPQSFTGDEPLTATLDRLVLLQEKRTDEPGPDSERDPRTWPNLRIRVSDLVFDEHDVGDVDLKATRVSNGLQIDSVNIVQEHAQAEANGQWLLMPEGERSSLSLKILSSDVGATLRKLSYPPFMEARHGEVHADLAWNGGFNSNFLGRASGTLKVAAEGGQLSTLQPGAGRVLGLFSVAALPRRLALDFSDLTEKGLGFDNVTGDFEMREGNAYTSNLLLRGPAAEIGIAGRTGLGSHDYDQTAVVTGNLGASLPVAGALAGGPAIGAALLLFTQVFKEPLKGITRGYYRITGSWDEPVVERVEAAAIKEAASSRTSSRTTVR